jgi:hypothetical protein
MLKNVLFTFGLLAVLVKPTLSADPGQNGRVSEETAAGAGTQESGGSGNTCDLHMVGRQLTSFQVTAATQVLQFQDGFAMSAGENRFHSDNSVVWLDTVAAESEDQIGTYYSVLAYLQGNVSLRKAPGTEVPEVKQLIVEDGNVMVVRFTIGGEVFVTAEQRAVADPRSSELYAAAFAAVQPTEPNVPPALEAPPERPLERDRFRVAGPVNIAPASDVPLEIEAAQAPDGNDVATVIGRVYAWQKVVDERTGTELLLELEADQAVIYYRQEAIEGKETQGQDEDEKLAAGDAVRAIYMAGDVAMTEGLRTIRADEIFYDFQERTALIVNATMRSFDVSRQIPIYVRAAKLKLIAANKFSAEHITLTTSEFYVPQISLSASDVVITDRTAIDAKDGEVSDGSYDVRMRDVRFKYYDHTFFYWPQLRSNLQRPDIPLKGIHTGHDRTWGTSLETRWYLARLLGLKEPEGTDSTIGVDYYSRRGMGGGVNIEYTRENYFGRIIGYIIDDHGEDRLGRHYTRKDLEPPRELRGRFKFQHRHFLPYNWQLTAETSYLSDRHFLEQYYRAEFNTDKEQETIVHAKRIEDNWGLSLLGKWRINDFADKLEELPGAEFHWTGQSLFDDKLTFYSDSQVNRFRQRSDSNAVPVEPQDVYGFASTRNELDAPMQIGRSKVVPFVAGTFGYDDGAGFGTKLDGSMVEQDKEIWIGETGVRVSSPAYWKVYPNVKSRVWDVNKLRHTVKPYMAAVAYTESDSVAEQRDTLHAGISQRLQTKRGRGDKVRTVDWMRLDVDVTWVNDSADPPIGPDRFLWNKPFIPLASSYSRQFGDVLLPPQDRRSSDIFGPRRNYIGADYIWRLSDTTAVLSDMNYDIQSGVVQQFNIGFSRMRWPNLSYYIGSRYLRRLNNGLGEHGSNALTFAATYILDPRYTVVLSQQFDLDYGLNIRSDITLVRRYHRLCFGLTYRADESLDQHAVILSLWPQGVPELALGPRRYLELGGAATY